MKLLLVTKLVTLNLFVDYYAINVHFHTVVLNGTTYWDTGRAEIPDVDKFRVIDLVPNTANYFPRDSQHAVLIEAPSSKFELKLEQSSLFSLAKMARFALTIFFDHLCD
mgnify:FL=1